MGRTSHPGLAWCVLAAAGLAAGAAGAQEVTLGVDVTIDQLGEGAPPGYAPGSVDHLRITYDAAEVDPSTRRVRLRSLAHQMGERWVEVTPALASSLDLSAEPLRLEFAASVVHGTPIVVLFEALTQRMAILARPDFHPIIAGHYVIHAPASADSSSATTSRPAAAPTGNGPAPRSARSRSR